MKGLTHFFKDYLLFVLFLVLLTFGCAPVAKFHKTIDYYVDPTDKSEQTKQGVTIKMSFVNYEELKNNRLFTQTVKEKALLSDQINVKEIYVDPFKNELAFNVTITNNTDHILRMKDSRVVFAKGLSMDNPVKAQTKQELITNIEIHPTVLHYRTKRTPVYNEVADSWVEALKRIITSENLKIINDVGMEIYPKFSASGILIFPIPPESAVDGKVTFFDITTKVDNAGIPIEKEHFDFSIKPKEHFYKTLGKETVEISREEYNTKK